MAIVRHEDHDPLLVCRPAFGNGLCEPLSPELTSRLQAALAAADGGETEDLGSFQRYLKEDA